MSEQPKQAKRQIDWESVERGYRAGVLSIRELAKLHDISDKAVRNRAKEYGWERDLTERVQEKVRTELVRTESAPQARQTEREIVAAAAATVVHVVREHRVSLAAGRSVVSTLLSQLTDVAGNREAFIEAIEQECAEDETGERRNRMLKAISLPTHAATVRDLSNALKNLITLERQAFNVSDAPPEEPEVPAASAAQVDEGFAQLRAAFNKRLNKPDDAPAAA